MNESETPRFDDLIPVQAPHVKKGAVLPLTPDYSLTNGGVIENKSSSSRRDKSEDDDEEVELIDFSRRKSANAEAIKKMIGFKQDHLAFEEENIIMPSTSLVGNLVISLFWEEKIILFFQTFQFYAVLFNIFYEQFPQEMQSGLSFLNLLVLNFPYLSNYEETLENYEVGFLYGIVFTGILFVLAIMGLIFIFTGTFSKCVLRLPHIFLKYTIYVCQLLVFPFLINTLPYALGTFVTTFNHVTQFDPWAESRQMPLLLCGLVVIIILCVFSIVLMYVAGTNYVFSSNLDHENHLKIKEVEYVLNLNSIWRGGFYFLFSSYKRSHFRIFHRGLYILFQILLILLHSALVRTSITYLNF
jgi:hypothetical protein